MSFSDSFVGMRHKLGLRHTKKERRLVDSAFRQRLGDRAGAYGELRAHDVRSAP
jgi:hypothetical protein